LYETVIGLRGNKAVSQKWGWIYTVL